MHVAREMLINLMNNAYESKITTSCVSKLSNSGAITYVFRLGIGYFESHIHLSRAHERFPKQQGFTLIEILLVIVIATVLSAMVAPSFFQSTGASVNGEARYIQKLLRLASEEAQLSGTLIRCSVYHDELVFEQPDADSIWQPLQDDLFQPYPIREPVWIKQAHLHGDVVLDNNAIKQDKKPSLARFYLWPDGRVSSGSIDLASKPASNGLKLELASGPGGIHVVEPVSP